MQKKFITNLAFLLFLNLLIKPFWILGIDRSVQNAVGAEQYGLYYALFNFSFLFNILLDLGISNFNNKNIAQNQALLNKNLSGIIFLRIILAVIYISISLFIGLLIGYELSQLSLLLLLLFNQVLISFILYIRSNYSGLLLFKQDSIISVLDRFLMICFTGYLLWFRKSATPFKIEWFIWSQTASYILTAGIAFFFLARKAQLQRLTWNLPFMRMILRQSYPFALLVLIMTIYFRIDGVMIERLLPDGKEKAGIYAQAFRLLDAASMIAYLFAALLYPIFSRMIKMKEQIHELLRLSYSLLVIPAFITGLLCFFFKSEIMHLLYHEHVDLSAPAFGLMMFTFGAVSTSYIYGTLLTANGSLGVLNKIAGCSLFLNVILNMILIPKLEVTGAAIAGLVTQYMSALLQALFAYRIFKMSPDRKYVLSIMAVLVLSFALLWLLRTTGLPWIWQFISGFGLAFLLSAALRIINLKSLYLILKKDL
ncbi:MAG: oligosaccharide flippase family protein [Bacteroidia bacterium]|nr:oligosaccharide flippase family protein [Bacteroidia bacterium]